MKFTVQTNERKKLSKQFLGNGAHVDFEQVNKRNPRAHTNYCDKICRSGDSGGDGGGRRSKWKYQRENEKW